MHKLAVVLVLAFLLLSLLAAHDASARPLSAVASLNTSKSQETEFNQEELEDPCEAGISEDECLMRRSLAAHVDYIYTQKNKKP